ncbi:MAG: DNA translocase FtsK 4TM domain-containing protein [Firmicutes bacterium]|nr:DNA translocase FtsK 4TM domain-containing protein [Bacillota bacterium]
MPNTDKQKTAAKSGRGTKNSSANKNTRGVKSSPAIKKEIKLIGLVVFGVLLLIAVFTPGTLGVVGPFFRNILIGLFGLGGFLLPIAIICFAFLGFISKEISIPIWRSIILAWVVLAWLYVIVNPVGENFYTAFEYLREVYRSAHPAAGGLIGSLLGSVVVTLAARAGAIIIFSTLIIILLVWITNSSFIKLVEGGVGKARDLYEERAARRYEDTFEYEEEEQEKPAAKPVNKNKPKPVPGRQIVIKNGEEKAALIDIDTESEDKEEYTVLLIQEEIHEKDAKPPREIPQFIRAAKIPKEDTKSKIITFADDDEVDGADEGFEEDISVDFVYDPEGSSSPPESSEGKSDAGFVIKGMVDDAQPSTPPLFEYDDDTDPVEYDEYALASRAKKPSLPVSHTAPAAPTYENFQLPTLDLLSKNVKINNSAESATQVRQNSRILEETLRSFRVEAEVVEVSVGPTVTRYDISPGPGVKVSSIANLSNDLALSLAAHGIRIEAPIPGKSAVGIEVPNEKPQGVFLREILESERFGNFSSKLAFAVGKDIAGSPVIADVADMPHLLIAGATGAGKSVCINTLIASLLYKARPDEVKLLMIDPKVVELSVYNGIPHLLIPVVTDPKKASGALNWAVQEMESRYSAFAETGCRELKGYNRYLAENDAGPPLPQIVIIIDELADLMMSCKGEVEEAICRLAQKARAAGIHLIVATQRPSVDVITGLIKANIPSRLAFAVSSGTDSRTVLDMYGAEKLLGRGDMLFLPRGQNKPIRIQGAFISDKEVEGLVKFLKAQAPITHTTEMIQQITMPGKANIEGDVDEFFHDAVDFLLVKGKASTSMLQRQFRIGYNRASRLMEDLEIRGIVGPEDGVKPRKVTITREEYDEIYGDR